MSRLPRVPDAAVALSTTATYPEPTEVAFEIAAKLGYDGVELMVFTDATSQDVDAVARLVDTHGIPVLAVHAPCLLLTQRVWGTDPWAKLRRATEAAEMFGAATVVVHPPFRWQRDYVRGFAAGLERLRDETDVVVAVENMYPWRAAGREVGVYAPGWDPSLEEYPALTLDLSHTAVAGVDALEIAQRLGPRLAHLHLADGSGSGRDEHLVPGRGTQPAAAVLELLAATGYTGVVVAEVSTRRASGREEREADLAEALAFARLNLAVAAGE